LSLQMEELSSQTLKKLTFELDCEFGCLKGTVSTIVAAEVLLEELADSMEIAAYRGQVIENHPRHLRMIKVLSELMHYKVNDLNKESNKASDLHEVMFKKILNNGEVNINE
jgi:hypothetical protein